MGEAKRLRTVMWKNEQFNKAIDALVKEMMKTSPVLEQRKLDDMGNGNGISGQFEGPKEENDE